MHNRPRKKSDDIIDLQKEEVKRKKIAKYNELKKLVLEAVRVFIFDAIVFKSFYC